MIKKYLKEIETEYRNARTKFEPLHSAHEGYAVIKEELEELWEDVKVDNLESAKKEAIQIGAMALAFLVEIDGH